MMRIPRLSPPCAGIFFGRSNAAAVVATMARVAPGIHAIILAAGQSQRFGRVKLLEELNGRALVQHSLDVARSVFHSNSWLVTGHSADGIEDAASGLAGHILYNPEYAQGMGSSIACGATACSNRADAIVIMLADQPLISRSHLENLVHRWTGDDNAIIATEFDGILGPPVLFGRDHFAELRALRGDTGAKQILETHANAVNSVRFDPAAVDIDTPGDLARLVSPD